MTADELLEDGALGVEEASRFAGIGRTVLYKLMGDGSLPYVKLGARRLIPKRCLVKLLAAGLASRADEK